MKIKKNDITIICGISKPTLNTMLRGSSFNPKLTTITKLANFFNSSIDEMLGRDSKYYINKPKNFQQTDGALITKNLLSVVENTMAELNISALKLANKINVNTKTLSMFLDPNVSATPGATTTLALANFLDASIDDMIGRRKPSYIQQQKLDIPKQLSSLSKQDIEKLSDIKHSVKSDTSQDQNFKKTTSTKHLNKHRDEGRSR